MYCDVIHLVVVKKEKRDETKDIVRVIDGFGKLLSVSGSAFLNWHSRIKSSRIEFINVKPNAESGCFSFYQLYATEYKITTKLKSFNTQCRQFNYTCKLEDDLHRMLSTTELMVAPESYWGNSHMILLGSLYQKFWKFFS